MKVNHHRLSPVKDQVKTSDTHTIARDKLNLFQTSTVKNRFHKLYVNNFCFVSLHTSMQVAFLAVRCESEMKSVQNKMLVHHNARITVCQSFGEIVECFDHLANILREIQQATKREGEGQTDRSVKNRDKINHDTSTCLRCRHMKSDCGLRGLSAEEVEGHCREEYWDAVLVMQMKGNHLSQGLGEFCFHELHTSTGALRARQRTHTHTHIKIHQTLRPGYSNAHVSRE